MLREEVAKYVCVCVRGLLVCFRLGSRSLISPLSACVYVRVSGVGAYLYLCMCEFSTHTHTYTCAHLST